MHRHLFNRQAIMFKQRTVFRFEGQFRQRINRIKRINILNLWVTSAVERTNFKWDCAVMDKRVDCHNAGDLFIPLFVVIFSTKKIFVRSPQHVNAFCLPPGGRLARPVTRAICTFLIHIRSSSFVTSLLRIFEEKKR